MNQKDHLGNTLSGASAFAAERFARAAREFHCYIDDPVATLAEATADSPAFVMGHVMNAYLNLLGTEPSGLPAARESLQNARRAKANERERAHVEAASSLVDGRWHAAARTLEDIAIEHPRDVLALQVGHQVDFFIGDSRMLRDRIARALPAWSATMPGYHAMLSMHAFGLEESGHYARAEDSGRRAVLLEPRDGWGQHAVAHVLEMQGRQQDGITWMRANPQAWSKDNFFSVHNWWHLALYHLDLEQVDEVLALFDGPIFGKRPGMVLELVDASALLWRLHLRGIDVGDRFALVADNWQAVAGASEYAFNDAHAMMAFVGAGREDAASMVLETQTRALAGAGDNAMFVRDAGAPVTQAIHAFGRGDYAECVDRLRPVRGIAHRFGGSHAQRDLIDLTLVEAALRDGQVSLARALANERVSLKPTTPAVRTLLARCGEGRMSRLA